MKKIIITENTFLSDRSKVVRGQELTIGDDVTAEDAAILVERKMARDLDKPTIDMDSMKMAAIKDELDKLKVAYPAKAKKEELFAILVQAIEAKKGGEE